MSCVIEQMVRQALVLLMRFCGFLKQHMDLLPEEHGTMVSFLLLLLLLSLSWSSWQQCVWSRVWCEQGRRASGTVGFGSLGPAL